MDIGAVRREEGEGEIGIALGSKSIDQEWPLSLFFSSFLAGLGGKIWEGSRGRGFKGMVELECREH